jgi:hypothetical protein
MAIVIKTIRGRQYRYAQRSYRINGKVKTKSVYLGPVGGRVRRQGVLGQIGEFITANLQHEHVFDMEALGREQQEREQQKAAKVTAGLAELHERYGLVLGPRIPVPIEKVPRGVAQRAPPPPAAPEIEARQQDAPSDIADGAVDETEAQ